MENKTKSEGKSNDTRFRHTQETKDKLSAMRKGENNPFYGKTHSAETRAKFSLQARAFNANRTFDLNPLSIKTPSEVHLAYIAGLIDGEGSVALKKGQPQIYIYNCFEPVMNWLVEIVGGTYRVAHRNGRSPNFCWGIGGAKNVYHLLTIVSPFLIIKKLQKDEVLNFLITKYSSRLWESQK